MTAGRNERAHAFDNMLRATSPDAARLAPLAIPDDELWPDLEPGDFDVGEIAATEIEADDAAWQAIWTLFEDFWTHGFLLPLEQSCDGGSLLPPELREARLRRLPTDLAANFKQALHRVPPPVIPFMAMYTYWTLRSSRARRTGSPELGEALRRTTRDGNV